MLPLQHPAEYRESAAETALSQRKEKRGISAAGTDGWESNPPQAVLETASPSLGTFARMLAALWSCPTLALRGKSPSLAVASSYEAPMPQMSPLGHFVERCGESCATIFQALEVPLRRGPRAALLIGLPPLLLPGCQVGLSRFLRLTRTAGSDPVFGWSRWGRTTASGSQSPVPYRLAMLQYPTSPDEAEEVRRASENARPIQYPTSCPYTS